MSNPFNKQETDWVDIVDDPDGQRVWLECLRCFYEVTAAKYFPKQKLLTWKCPACNYLSAKDIDLGE